MSDNSKVVENAINQSLQRIYNNKEEIIYNSNITQVYKRRVQRVIKACKQFMIEYETKKQALDQYYKKRKGIVTKVQEAENKQITGYINYYEERKMLGTNTELKEAVLEYQKVLMSIEKSFIEVQMALGELYGYKVKMLFVDRDEAGDLVLYESEPSIDFLKGNPYANERTLIYDFQKIRKDQFRLQQQASAALQSTGQEVYNRYELSRQLLKDTTYLSKRSNGIVYWLKNSGKYEMYWVNNKGTIAETFATFYVHSFVFAGSNMEKNIATFVTHKKFGMISVDNASGVFLGDTSRNRTQYHIKGLNATPASMTNLYYAVKYLFQVLNTNEGTLSDQAFVEALGDFVTSPGVANQVKKLSQKYTTEEMNNVRSAIKKGTKLK